MLKSHLFAEIKDYLFILLGITIYCMGVVYFILPYNITTGGLTGVATIVYYVTGLPIQYLYFTVNAILLIIAIKVLGWRFCVKTIFGVAMMTIMLSSLQEIAKAETGQLPTIVGDQGFMACIIGAMMNGVGLATVFLHNGSTGGTDIIAAIVNKYRPVSIGRTLICCDLVIVGSLYFFFPGQWERIVYGCIMLITTNLMLDYVMNSATQSVQFFIFSRHYEEIATAINKQLHRGVTILNGEGWYSHQPSKVIVLMARQRESVSIFRLIKEIDPQAFVSKSKVEGVYGNGFDRIKVSAKAQKKNKEATKEGTVL